MFETHTEPSRIDEINRCRDGSWLAIEEADRFGIPQTVDVGEYKRDMPGNTPATAGNEFGGLMHLGQNVFLPGDQLIGAVTKLFRNPNGQVIYLAVRTARLFGRHKIIPIASVGEVTPERIELSVHREQFMALPGYHTDLFIADQATRQLWKDVVLRDTDYDQIDVRVKDGVILLNGHVITSMNQWRVECAVKNIPGVVGVKSYLIPDDQLAIKVANVLGQIESREQCKFFTKVENGVVRLTGDVSSSLLREQAEQSVAEIPWVRGVLNEIQVPGLAQNSEDQRFLQPLIGNPILFKDGVPVTIQKVIINPHNRRVMAVIASGQSPTLESQERNAGNVDQRSPDRWMVLPVSLIDFLTNRGGFLRINSDEMVKLADYMPSQYNSPEEDWLPPYPYCPAEVLFPGNCSGLG